MKLGNPLTLVLFASLLLGAGPEPAAAPSGGAPFAVGEKLVYDGRVWKGLSFIGLSVGTATLEVKQSDRPEWPASYLFLARAKGGALGYTATATARSYLDAVTLLPVHASLTQRGSEVHDKEMVFRDGQVVYMKKKHCKEWKSCDDRRHLVRHRVSRGFLRGYDSVRRHCRDRDCDNRAHYVWKAREKHVIDRPTYDMLSVIYICRNLDLPIGGKGEVIRVVNQNDMWDVNVCAVDRERIEVPAGKFKCVRIQISPKPATEGSKIKKDFEGLFGIRGKIQIWVDEQTRVPVRIRGVVPFGVDLNMEVSLIKQEIPSSDAASRPLRPGA